MNGPSDTTIPERTMYTIYGNVWSYGTAILPANGTHVFKILSLYSPLGKSRVHTVRYTRCNASTQRSRETSRLAQAVEINRATELTPLCQGLGDSRAQIQTMVACGGLPE